MDSYRQKTVVLLLLITRVSPSSYATSNRPNLEQKPWDDMHTAQVRWRRDAGACPTNYATCPASLNGGCCPTDRSCGIESCHATTTAPLTACSKSGYFACGIDQGGGCCPGGYSCMNDGCLPLSGATDIQTCSVGSFSCAPSLGGGCCRNNYACGAGAICYQTSFSSVSLTETILTTNSNADPVTITRTYVTAYQETYTPYPSSAVASSTVARFTLTSSDVPKVQPSSSSDGLTRGQLGGIVAVAVGVVFAVFLAAFFIIRRLNAVVKIQKGATNSGTGTNTRSSHRHKPHPPPVSTAYINYDTLSIDPLMISDTTTAPPNSVRLPRPSAVHSIRSELDSSASSPPIPEPYGSPHSLNSESGYQQVPSSEQNYFDSQPMVPHSRNRSTDSETHNISPNIGYGAGGYFDPSDPALRDQNLWFGHLTPSALANRPSVHGRQWSDASDVSALSGGNAEAVELDGAPLEERHGSVGGMASMMQRMGLSKSSRRHGEEGRRRSSSSGTAVRGPQAVPYPSQVQRLDRVQEASNIALDQMPRKPKEEINVSQMEVRTSPQQGSQSRFREEGLGIQTIPPLERELEMLEGQKFIGSVSDLMGKR